MSMPKKEAVDLKDWKIQPGEISINAVLGKEVRTANENPTET